MTLMALGSSAPEILLSVIEVIGNSFYTGELGPSTIVGSAAFNLMCICAVLLHFAAGSAICKTEKGAGLCGRRNVNKYPVAVLPADFSHTLLQLGHDQQPPL